MNKASPAAAAPSTATENSVDQQFAAAQEKMRKRFGAFLKLNAEADQFLNPFVDHSGERPPLLVCYILWCIDELSAAELERLSNATAELQETYHPAVDWQTIVASAMGFDENWPRQVQAAWEHQKTAEPELRLAPIEFSKMIMETLLHL